MLLWVPVTLFYTSAETSYTAINKPSQSEEKEQKCFTTVETQNYLEKK